MKRKLREELVKLSTDIITSREDKGLTELYEKAKELYEKLAVLKFIDEKLNDVEVDVAKNVVASRFEAMANKVISGNTAIPENNPHQEDIITPGMHTIKEMVSEMPNEALEYIFGDFMARPQPMKNDMEQLTPLQADIAVQEDPKSLNDSFGGKTLQIGLNDKLAFVKHLFNGNMDEYQKMLNELKTIATEERSRAFIATMVKPEYGNWAGKEEYEQRLMGLIARKFS